MEPSSREEKNAEVRTVLALEILVDGVEILRRNKNERVEVVAVGDKSSDRFGLEELANVQLVRQIFDG